jgi:hypothetical protein
VKQVTRIYRGKDPLTHHRIKEKAKYAAEKGAEITDAHILAMVLLKQVGGTVTLTPANVRPIEDAKITVEKVDETTWRYSLE